MPVLGSQHQLIREVKIDNSLPWRRKLKRTIQLAYARSPGRAWLPRLSAPYESEWERLVDLNVAFIKLFREALGIRTPLVVDEEISGSQHELLINICKKYQADTYLSGMGARHYMTDKYFSAMAGEGIAHRFVDRNLTAAYPYSTLHYLLAEGPERISEILRS